MDHESECCAEGMRPAPGHRQYNNDNGAGPQMMLISDMALIWDPTWRKLIEYYAEGRVPAPR